MAAKTDMVEWGQDLDIDALIAQGQKQAQATYAAAEEQAERLAKDAEADGLDITQTKCDLMKFQEVDYLDVRKALQDRINLRAQEELMGQVNEQGVFVRQRRAGAEAALEALKDGHDVFKAARARELEERRRRAEENGEPMDGLVPRKDHSIRVEKVWEFQFFDNFEALLQLG